MVSKTWCALVLAQAFVHELTVRPDRVVESKFRVLPDLPPLIATPAGDPGSGGNWGAYTDNQGGPSCTA